MFTTEHMNRRDFAKLAAALGVSVGASTWMLGAAGAAAAAKARHYVKTRMNALAAPQSESLVLARTREQLDRRGLWHRARR